MVFKNPELKKILARGGRRITLYKDDQLEKWLQNINKAWIPKQATKEEAYALMVYLWYTGARSSELAQLKKDDIYPMVNTLGIAITLKTLKKGKEYRKISIPINKFTTKAYQWTKNSMPTGYLFHNFRCSGGNSKYTIKWINHKTIYVKTKNGIPLPEEYDEPRTKTYYMHNKKIRKFVNSLTGLPPLYFRHHRLSWMAKLKGTQLQLKEFKGSKSFKSVEPYLQLGQEAEKEYLDLYPK